MENNKSSPDMNTEKKLHPILYIDDEQDNRGIRPLPNLETKFVAANTLICLINQTSYLLGRQLKRLERDFLAEGGFTERLYRERTRRRGV